MWRWSLLSVVVISVFWATFYLVNGSIPATANVNFWFPEWTFFKLNFAIPMWFDILAGPLWLCTLVYWFDKKADEDLDGLNAATFVCWVMVAFSMFIALTEGIASGILTAILTTAIILAVYLVLRILSRIVNWANAK